MSFKKRLMIWLVAGNALLGAALIGLHYYRLNQQRQRSAAIYRREATDFVDSKAMTPEVSQRWADLNTQAQIDHRISDEDLDWVIAQTKDGTGTSQSGTNLRHQMMGSILLALRNPPPTQQEKMYQTALLLLHQDDKVTGDYLGSGKIVAGSLLAHLKRKDAIPMIVPLLQDKRQFVRIGATNALYKLGYPIKPIFPNGYNRVVAAREGQPN